ncbi:Helix-turn-helix domain of resolvase [compost metagenome]
MNRIEYSTRRKVEIDRDAIAGMVRDYQASGGQITIIPGIEQRLDRPYQWNRNDLCLPGSSTITAEQNKAARIAQQIRELADKGAGITAIKMALRMDVDRIKRIAAEHKIVIKHANTQKRELGAAARQACVDRGKLRRSKLEPAIRRLCAEGLTIRQIAERADCSRRTVFRIIDEFQIKRGRDEQDAA